MIKMASKDNENNQAENKTKESVNEQSKNQAKESVNEQSKNQAKESINKQSETQAKESVNEQNEILVKENVNKQNIMKENEREKNGNKAKVKERNKKIRNILLIALFNLVFPFLIYFASNIINQEFLVIRDSRLEMAKFFLSQIDKVMLVYGGIFLSFVYEFALIYGLYFLFKAIFKKSLRGNIALAVVFNIISIISYYKMSVVSKPFLPEDVLLVGDALEIAGYGSLKFEPIILIQILVVIGILVVQWLITKYTKYENKMKVATTIIMAVLSIATVCGLIIPNWTVYKGFEENSYNQMENYTRYGANVEFFRNMYSVIQKPKLDIYSEERIEEIKNRVENGQEEQEAQGVQEGQIQEGQGEEILEEQESPNIITIMVESFSDITKIDWLQFEKDPLPTYRSLINHYPSGNIVSSIFAGETSMSEFEFLTGSSTRFLEGKKYPYFQILKDDTISVTSVLKEQGYYTTAIHANDGNFYNRDKAYKYLGFDKMVFEPDMENIDNVYDNNISDMDTAEEIVKQYEAMGDSKKFIFAITKELHSPLSANRYPENEIGVNINGKIDDEEVSIMKTYTQGLYNFDKSLNYLLNYFKQKEEKVMIVFFGDHLPPLHETYEIEYGDGIGKYETPYIIWTNYELNTETVEKYSKNQISIAGLAMMALEVANIDIPWYYEFINQFYKQYPVCTNKFLVDKEGRELDINTSNELIDDYNIIVFDLLYEKNIELR